MRKTPRTATDMRTDVNIARKIIFLETFISDVDVKVAPVSFVGACRQVSFVLVVVPIAQSVSEKG